MSVDYKGLMRGDTSPLELAHLLKEAYGGGDHQIRLTDTEGHYVIVFYEAWTPEEEAMGMLGRMRTKTKPRYRQLHVWVNGACGCDYAQVSADPMTYLSLGNFGDAKTIIDTLVAHTGGFVWDEAKVDEWQDFEESIAA